VTKIDDYMELLATEGYRPTKDDEDTLIYFKAEGTRYRLQFFEEDTDYIRLSAMWGLDDDTAEDVAYRAVSEVNRQMKFAKVSIEPAERGVLVSWEALYKEPAHAAPFLERALNQLDSCASYFFKRVEDLQRPTEESDGAADGEE
jgi:hypothetical protein